MMNGCFMRRPSVKTTQCAFGLFKDIYVSFYYDRCRRLWRGKCQLGYTRMQNTQTYNLPLSIDCIILHDSSIYIPYYHRHRRSIFSFGDTFFDEIKGPARRFLAFSFYLFLPSSLAALD